MAHWLTEDNKDLSEERLAMGRTLQRPYTPTPENTAFSRLAAAAKFLIIRCSAAALIVLAVIIFVSVTSYSVNDSSFNTSSIRPIENIMGPPGAGIADILLQLFGGAALLLPIALGVWGYHALRNGTPTSTPLTSWLKFFAWIASILAMAGFAGNLPIAVDWPFQVGMGGLWGDMIGPLVASPFALVGLPFATGLAATILLALATALSLYACGVKPEYLEAALDAAFYLIDHGIYQAKLLVYKIRTHGHLETQEEKREPNFDLATPEDEADIYSDTPLLDPVEQPLAAPAVPKRKIIREETKQKLKKAAPSQAELPVFSAENYSLPPVSLLAKPSAKDRLEVEDHILEQNARMLETVLADFGVRGEIVNVRPGPVVTLYELEPAAGVKSSRVINLSDDIARSMSAIACRVAVVPGRNAIGIELPNTDREMVFFREMLEAQEFTNPKSALTISLGKNIGGEPEYADLAKMPHLLIAGTTGSGKSVGINTMILSLLYRLPPDQCKMIMVDPKMLELSVYEGIPHLLAPVVTDPKKAVVALKWTVREMEERYRQMSKVGVRNITGFNDRVREADKNGENLNRTVHTGYDGDTGEPVYETEELNYKPMPFIVVVIDEVADLMMVAGKDIEGMVQRLAQMARAAGIHLIMATQRPSVDVITGTIKANFPTRISFQVTSKIDSRTILGEQGAEQLLGQGDMLYMAGGGRLTRIHGSFASDDEVEKIVSFLKKQGKPDYVQEVTEMREDDPALEGLDLGGNTSSGDALYDKALAIVARDRKASTSYIQRRLQIGYNRAATLIERLEEDGIISPANHAGKREVLIGEDAA